MTMRPSNVPSIGQAEGVDVDPTVMMQDTADASVRSSDVASGITSLNMTPHQTPQKQEQGGTRGKESKSLEDATACSQGTNSHG